MNAKEAAKFLNGNEYGDEGSPSFFTSMKEAGLVAVFGASDDLIEFRGAIHDEVDAYNGGKAYLNRNGLLVNNCDSDRCPHFEQMKRDASAIEALWCEEEGFSFIFRTAIPHETFVIYEDGETYCRGIVFALAEATP